MYLVLFRTRLLHRDISETIDSNTRYGLVHLLLTTECSHLSTDRLSYSIEASQRGFDWFASCLFRSTAEILIQARRSSNPTRSWIIWWMKRTPCPSRTRSNCWSNIIPIGLWRRCSNNCRLVSKTEFSSTLRRIVLFCLSRWHDRHEFVRRHLWCRATRNVSNIDPHRRWHWFNAHAPHSQACLPARREESDLALLQQKTWWHLVPRRLTCTIEQTWVS